MNENLLSTIKTLGRQGNRVPESCELLKDSSYQHGTAQGVEYFKIPVHGWDTLMAAALCRLGGQTSAHAFLPCGGCSLRGGKYDCAFKIDAVVNPDCSEEIVIIPDQVVR